MNLLFVLFILIPITLLEIYFMNGCASWPGANSTPYGNMSSISATILRNYFFIQFKNKVIIYPKIYHLMPNYFDICMNILFVLHILIPRTLLEIYFMNGCASCPGANSTPYGKISSISATTLSHYFITQFKNIVIMYLKLYHLMPKYFDVKIG